MKKQRFRKLSITVAAVLMGVILFGEPAGIYANLMPGFTETVYADEVEEETSSEDSDKDLVYVSDVRLFDSNDSKKAKQACEDAGYTLVNSDLNQGTGKNVVEDWVSDAGDGAQERMW